MDFFLALGKAAQPCNGGNEKKNSPDKPQPCIASFEDQPTVGHVLPKINKSKPKGPQRTRPAAARKTKDEDSKNEAKVPQRTRPATARNTKDEKDSMTSADKSVGRSRRRAAPSVGSLKEVSTRAKLRQGDPTSSSIYTDFVPGTKSHSGTR